MSDQINNPLDYNFRDKVVDKWIKEEVELAVEFIDSDEDRRALERNVLNTIVEILNTIMTNLDNTKQSRIKDKIKSYMTEYL